jgi:predicted secreted protein
LYFLVVALQLIVPLTTTTVQHEDEVMPASVDSADKKA